MANRKTRNSAQGKLLDAWTAPDDAGAPIGCLAATFTFSSEFFETECLSRFVRMESDPDEDGAAYLIEREEKLCQLDSAAVLVDRHHCRGSRSPRWDLLAVRPRRGIQHAKVSLLYWADHLRLIIASANLTEDGYRRNREVYGVLDYRPGERAPVECLRQAVDFLEGLLAQTDGGDGRSPAVERSSALLDRVRRTALGGGAEGWSLREPPRAGGVTVHPIFVGPERPDLLNSLGEAWPVRDRPRTADVVSPFFDPPDARHNRPAASLGALVGTDEDIEARVRFHVVAEETQDGGGLIVHAPESLRDAAPGGEIEICRVTDEPARPLHAKAIRLEGDYTLGSVIGSSNFTSAGLGLGATANHEANLLYLVDDRADAPTRRALRNAFPDSEPVPPELELRWEPPEGSEDTPDAAYTPLPDAFGAAVFDHDEEGHSVVRLAFNARPPEGWRLTVNETDEPFVDAATWEANGRPHELVHAWPEQRPPPYGFTVRWEDSASAAWWPVNIESATALPPPEELRNLPLEVLIDVLTSGRPLHRAMRIWLRRRNTAVPTSDNGASEVEIDPHKRVDTSGFLLQRTRRVSWALLALRERLERPVASRQALAWRLHGPVGVEALANALTNEAATPQERSFLLAELALELTRLAPQPSAGLDAEEVHETLAATSRSLVDRIEAEQLPAHAGVRRYIDNVIEEVTARYGATDGTR